MQKFYNVAWCALSLTVLSLLLLIFRILSFRRALSLFLSQDITGDHGGIDPVFFLALSLFISPDCTGERGVPCY